MSVMPFMKRAPEDFKTLLEYIYLFISKSALFQGKQNKGIHVGVYSCRHKVERKEGNEEFATNKVHKENCPWIHKRASTSSCRCQGAMTSKMPARDGLGRVGLLLLIPSDRNFRFIGLGSEQPTKGYAVIRHSQT